MSLVFISHDIALASTIADRIAVFRAGRMVEIGDGRDVLSHPREAYTRALIEACRSGAWRPQDGRGPRMSAPLLTVRGVSKSFVRCGQEDRGLEDVSLDLARGETLALVGPSGSGKSTLARIVMRLIEPDGGTISFDGADLLAARGEALRRLRPRIPDGVPGSARRLQPARDGCGRARRSAAHPWSAGRAERPRSIAALLERVGLERHLAGGAIHEISGGQRQRVAIARAIATRPSLLVLDEAVSALDVPCGPAYSRCCRSCGRRNSCPICSSRTIWRWYASFADRIAIMDAGRIVETGAAAAVVGDAAVCDGQGARGGDAGISDRKPFRT